MPRHVRNIGTNDRLARAALGMWLLAWSLTVPSPLARVALVALALFCFYMSVYAWCALYAFLGRKTCPPEE